MVTISETTLHCPLLQGGFTNWIIGRLSELLTPTSLALPQLGDMHPHVYLPVDEQDNLAGHKANALEVCTRTSLIINLQ